MVGNVWEWNSDVFINKRGLNENELGRIDNLNNDLNGYDLETFASSTIDSMLCYNPILGVPAVNNAGFCIGDGSVDPLSLLTTNDYFSEIPIEVRHGMLSGGNNVNFSNSAFKAGLYSNAFLVSELPVAGVRCGIRITE